jgi:serine/threonine protein phosphatase PrpC
LRARQCAVTLAASMARDHVAEHAALSDVGREREGNEDSFLDRPPLFVVADGMGGAQAGEVASGMAVDSLADASAPDELERAIEQANARIHARAKDDSSLAGMGTTLTAAWVDDGTVTLAHVGDSRAYRMRAGELVQLTEDHSLVGGLVRLGKITPAEAEHHPQRSVILRAVGVEPAVEVDVTEHDLEDGDVYLLCSDGLSGMVRDEVIRETLAIDGSLEQAADLLVGLANASGGHDNITAVLFRITLA